MEFLHAIFENMGIKREHQRAVVRVLWVLAVTGHMLWVCGFLAALGLVAPFARAGDVDKLLRATEVNARLSMVNEIRVQTRAYCQTDDNELKGSARRRIDELREELWQVSQIRVADPQCLRGAP
jgi:hypothetical protein